uniref:dual-specificity kinase n=2 Tax=Salix viminalis TaxID=40686 RepID=A0A6N2LEP6_SALVM
METQRITEFPHKNMDKRPRKRQRLTWEIPPPPPPLFAPPKVVPGMFCCQEFGNGNGMIPNYGLFYNRNGSPPWRPDDKDGHYVFAIGDNLTPRYRILSKMGEGTFGQVLECLDNEKKEVVAIKIIRSIHKYREAAVTEIDVLQRLARHDIGSTRCVQIRNWFDYRNHICIVFEKLGPSLYDFLRKNSYRSFPIDLVRELGRQLLESVAFMHDLHLIHTDLKPENILLVSPEYIKVPDYKFLSRSTKDGSYFKNLPKSSAIKLIDFGSTTFEHQDHSYVVSTRHYRAPEVILGLGWNYPCDIWSVGCILVELCSGEALFQTHENLEHLAMMERVLGPLPQHMVVRADRRAEKYSESMRLIAEVNLKRKHESSYQNLIMQHVDHSAGELIDLLQGLLRYDPAERLKAREALRHPFFSRNLRRYGQLLSCTAVTNPLISHSIPHRPSFPKPIISLSFKTPSSSSSSPFKFSSAFIRASSSRITPLNQTLSTVIKTTSITLTAAAAALFFTRLNIKPAIASPLTASSTVDPTTESSKENVSFEELERALQDHLSQNPNDIESLRSLMEVRIKSKKLLEAIEVVDRLIELEPNEDEWPLLKSQIYTYSGDFESAKEGFEAVLQKDPLCVEAYHGLVMANSESGGSLEVVLKRIESAMDKCRKEKKNSDLRDFKLLVAQVRVIEEKYLDALKVYDELVKEEPRDFRPYLCQGMIYTLLRKKDEAEKKFEQFKKLVPKNHPYREFLVDNMFATKFFSNKVERERS